MTAHRSSSGRLCRAALLTALLCVFSVITVPVGAVPMTLGLLGVLLCGMLLPPRYALFSVLGYLVLGAVGLPVFSAMQGGFGVLLGPTGGFLLAYPAAAWLCSVLCARIPHDKNGGRIPLRAAACIPGVLVCYGAGTVWYAFSQHTSVQAGFAVCVLPFLLTDAAKVAAAAVLGSLLRRRFPADTP